MNKTLGVIIILLFVGIALLVGSDNAISKMFTKISDSFHTRPIEKTRIEIKIINEKLDKLYTYTKHLDYQISIIEELLRNETHIQ